jgi:hypothetical protein
VGARLQYAKVVDRESFFKHGAKLHPGLNNVVVLNDVPGLAGAFLVMRAWTDDHGTFTEQWRIETPGGRVAYESAPREIHMATEAHVEKLEDEVVDLQIEFAADDYECVFVLDEREVARVRFPIVTNGSVED